MGMRACEGERQQGTRVTKERGREGGRRWEAARHAVGDGVGGGAGRSYSAAADRGGMDVSGEHWVGVEAYSGRLLPESARPVLPICSPGRHSLNTPCSAPTQSPPIRQAPQVERPKQMDSPEVGGPHSPLHQGAGAFASFPGVLLFPSFVHTSTNRRNPVHTSYPSIPLYSSNRSVLPPASSSPATSRRQ